MTLVPFVVEDTGRGERSMDIFSRLLMDRIVFIGGPIHDQTANLIIAQLLFLKMESPKKEISVYIHTPGGQITAGLAILDTMNFLECDVATYCIGIAASLGALLLSGGTKGKRFALPNSRIMLHQPRGGVGGTSADIEIQAGEIAFLKKRVANMLAKNTQKPLEQILTDSDRDFYMSPEEAIVYGLIDRVLEKPIPKQDKKKNSV